MIINDQSPFRRLPPHLDRKQTLFLDGIRYSIEMADLASSRLSETLFEISFNQEDSESKHLNTVSALQDAWSIVDSIHRLRGLLSQAPGFKQKAPGMRLFLQRTADIGHLRNSVQHLNNEIKSLVNKNLPVWGVLSWFAIRDPKQRSGLACSLIAGTLFESKNNPIVNPLGKMMHGLVDLITLTANERCSCLSDVMRQVEVMIKDMEKQLEQQFTKLPQAGSDVLICLEIEFGRNESPIQKDSV